MGENDDEESLEMLSLAFVAASTIVVDVAASWQDIVA